MTKLLDLLIYKLERFNGNNPLDLIDLVSAMLLVLAFLFYLRRFPVFRVVLGILFLLCLTIILFLAQFIFTGLVVGFATFMVLISLPLIFAPEIRHYLEKLGRFSFLRLPKNRNNVFIKNLVGAVYELAERKIGAIIVIERKTGLGQIIETGVIIDGQFGSKLLANLFYPGSPLHDGAVVIKDTKILAAGCLLPLNSEVRLDPPLGTRHKAGLSITKDTDAVVIIISEQRGQVSLAENGKLQLDLDRSKLTEGLQKLL